LSVFERKKFYRIVRQSVLRPRTSYVRIVTLVVYSALSFKRFRPEVYDDQIGLTPSPLPYVTINYNGWRRNIVAVGAKVTIKF